MVFDDSILGTSITVSNNGLRAARDEASFCNGVIFSKVEMISSLLTSCCVTRSAVVNISSPQLTRCRR